MIGLGLNLTNLTQAGIGGAVTLPVPLCLMPLSSDLSLTQGIGSATFVRANPVSTFEAPITGIVTAAGSNVARFETNGLLLEGSSENEFLRSEEHDNGVWVQTNNTTVTANTDTAPDGAVTADELKADLTGSDQGFLRVVTSQVGSTNYTMSSHIKEGVTNWIRLTNRALGGGAGPSSTWFDLDLGVLGTSGANVDNATIKAAANGFFRCASSGQTEAVPSVNLADTVLTNNDNVQTVDLNDTAILFGSQLEALNFASSYIPTTTVAITRSADDLDIDSDNIPDPTKPYTITLKCDHIGLDSALSQVLFNVEGETTRKIEWDTTTGTIKATHGAITSVSTSTFSAGDPVKLSLVVDDVNQILYIDGVEEDRDAKGTVTGTATAINIGHAASADQAYSHIKPFRTDAEALSAAQIAKLHLSI